MLYRLPRHFLRPIVLPRVQRRSLVRVAALQGSLPPGLGNQLLEFLILTVGLYSFQQWAYYRGMLERMEEDKKKKDKDRS